MYNAKKAATEKRRNAEKLGLCPQCGYRKLQNDRKQCNVCADYQKNYVKKNRVKINDNARKFTRKLRAKVLQALGGKCASVNCRYLNEDNTLGCKDLRILHVDHKFGNGNFDRQTLWSQQIWKKVLKNLGDFQLLCPTCNWIKRIEEKEYYRAIETNPITMETYWGPQNGQG